MGSIQEVLAARLKSLRNDRGMTQLKLSEIVGVEVTTVQNWEAARRWPQPRQVAALARALRVHESDLFRDPASIYEPTPKQALAVFKKLVDGIK
jgi:transcriptional regulator with XRE-family HTH domain